MTTPTATSLIPASSDTGLDDAPAIAELHRAVTPGDGSGRGWGGGLLVPGWLSRAGRLAAQGDGDGDAGDEVAGALGREHSDNAKVLAQEAGRDGARDDGDALDGAERADRLEADREIGGWASSYLT